MKHAEPLTVGGLLNYLGTVPTDTPVPLDLDSGSYRGYYEHVYVAPGHSAAGDLRRYLEAKVGTTMFGYKGGEYTYATTCYVFVAEYGYTGPMLGLLNGELVTIEEP